MSAFALSEHVLREPRLAEVALDDRPVWLFTPDGDTLLWANPAGRAVMKAGPVASAVRSQIALLAGRLPPGTPPRLERLRGFGAAFYGLRTCRCTRLQLAGEIAAIIVVALDAGPPLALDHQLAMLLGDADDLLALRADGTLVHASGAALARAGDLVPLERAGLAPALLMALKSGHGQGAGGQNLVEFFRVGTGDNVAVVARLHATRAQAERAAPAQPTPAADMQPAVAAANDTAAPATSPHYRHPLRFMWQTDAEGRFALGSDEFALLVGPLTMAAFGRPWNDIDTQFDLDPEGRIARALATRDTWSGIVVRWPVDGDVRLPVEMSGLPAFDRDRNFLGYRGFGVCRDLDGLNRLAAARWLGRQNPPRAARSPPRPEPPRPEPPRPDRPELANPQTIETTPDTSNQARAMPPEPPANVVPFRPAGDPRGTGPVLGPALSANESNAFDELARQLSERLTAPETPAALLNAGAEAQTDAPAGSDIGDTQKAGRAPDQPFGAPAISRPLLERLPVGILVYRLDRLLFANRAFLDFCGYATLDDLSEAGGLDALFVEPVESAPGNGEGRALRIATAQADAVPVDARLHSVPWHDETALALVMMPARAPATMPIAPPAAPAPVVASEPNDDADALARADELLDLAGDAIAALDAGGAIAVCNRTLEQWTGRAREQLIGTRLIDCLTQEGRIAAQQAIEAALNPNVTSLQRRDADGIRAHIVAGDGATRPVRIALSASRTDAGALNAVLRDESARRDFDNALRAAEGETRRAREARNGLLARISHEIRAPLNAIIGFANVMLDGRFGPIGNERYAAYLKDIRASGESVTALIDNLADLSHIETGQAEFRFAEIHLNDLVEHCVALMQPQANRQRIIIRTSLTHNLPPVRADARALRQVVTNLLTNSVALSEAGGQVIVSTALGDLGEVAVRVRDSGPPMSDADIAAAMDPFGPFHAGEPTGARHSGLSLPLTRALAEANKARFAMSAGRHGHGTLIEIVFPHAHARVS